MAEFLIGDLEGYTGDGGKSRSGTVPPAGVYLRFIGSFTCGYVGCIQKYHPNNTGANGESGGAMLLAVPALVILVAILYKFVL